MPNMTPGVEVWSCPKSFVGKLVQLYHDGYREGLEAAVECMDTALYYLHEAERAVKHKNDELWKEATAKQKACLCAAAEIRQRATELKQEPTP